MSEISNPKATADEPKSIPLKTLAAEKVGALRPDDSVQTAGERMREHDAATWPVAEERKLVGMIDEKNPDHQIGGRGHDPKTWQVGQIMSREVFFCYEDDDCASARKVMEEHGLRHLPVVDGDRWVGMLSMRDLLRVEVGEQGDEIKLLHEYIQH
jgi:CBS domain-containing protein